MENWRYAPPRIILRHAYKVNTYRTRLLFGMMRHAMGKLPGIDSGSKLRAARKAIGQTQRGLAEILEVSHSTVNRWERNKLEIQHPRMLGAALERLGWTPPRAAFKKGKR